jgi:formamidopyrimidine-DNA glycosylase
MPESPSIVLLKGEVLQFTGKKIIAVSGNSKIDQARLLNQKIIAFKSWGKHFLICFKEFTLRIHYLMFGSEFGVSFEPTWQTGKDYSKLKLSINKSISNRTLQMCE